MDAKANIRVEQQQSDGLRQSHSTNTMSASLASISLEDQQQFLGEHVLKIYKNDQNFKYLIIHKETTTKEVVMLALNEFNIIDDVGSG